MKQADSNMELSNDELTQVNGGVGSGQTSSKLADGGTVVIDTDSDSDGPSIGDATPLPDPGFGTHPGSHRFAPAPPGLAGL